LDHHFAQTRLISLENTHNRWGGTIYPIKKIKEMRRLADEHNLKMHLDGARLWNASVVSGISIKEYAGYFDSVSLCFSKGLGAPIGSIAAGSAEFIDSTHYYRKAYGGGMRQAGILAAAALYAIENNLERLKDDHRRARLLAEVFNTISGFVVDLQGVQTNIVIIDTSLNKKPAPQIAAELAEKGIKVQAFSSTRLRVVTHLDINDQDIDHTIEIIKKF
jgi:threonine aldolase